MRSLVAQEEAGAVAILYALTLLIMIGFAALVLDIGALRVDRRAAQTTADFASTAAAKNLGEGISGSPQDACEDALRYFRANTPSVALTDGEITTFCAPVYDPAGSDNLVSGFPADHSDCYVSGAFPDVGDEIERSLTVEPYRVTLKWPVDIDPDDYDNGYEEDIDGHRCERFSVQIDRTRDFVFGRTLDVDDQGSTGAAAIGRARTGTEGEEVAALLILDQEGCSALRTTGTNTVIKVDARDHEGEFITGKIHLDSDGSLSGGPDNCGGGSHTIDPANGKILALGNHSSPPAPGSIRLFAPDSPPCTGTACDPGDLLSGPNATGSGFWPQPRRAPDRTTRRPADHTFNCKDSYAGLLTARGDPWDIPSCPGDEEAHIDALRSKFGNAATIPTTVRWDGTPDTWELVTGADCEPSGTVVYTDNVYINCTGPQGFRVRGGADVTIEGNVVMRGKLNVGNDGTLAIRGDQDPSNTPHPDECVNSFEGCYGVSSQQAAYLYMGEGNLEVSGTSDLTLEHTAVVMRAGRVEATTGVVDWTAPVREGGQETPLWRLALWSETTAKTTLRGGGGSVMAGVFFTPNSDTEVAGGSGVDTKDAQYFAWRMNVVGNSTLEVAPSPETAIPVTTFSGVSLIR